MVRKILKGLMWVSLALVLVIGVLAWRNWDMVQRLFFGGVKVYETVPPSLPPDLKRPAILVFSKTNGFRHGDSIPIASKMLVDVAKEKGWGIYQTENGATFSPALLSRFDAVVFNNVSGDVFTPEQRAAFKLWLEQGGGFVGIHASGGDFSYAWDWYVNTLIGTQFIGHPMNPQFQKATVRIEDANHPATRSLPAAWSRMDEWYSFEKSVRRPGYTVLATLDESSYSPKGLWGQDLAMGKDHPIAWWHCTGKGRSFYSALGHTAESYREPAYKQMLAGAIAWSMRLDGEGCDVNIVKGVK